MIPKLVHQTWKSREVAHWIFKKSQASVTTHLPHWEYRFWTDSDLDAFVRNEFPQYYDSWKGFDRHIKRVDMARYFMLYKFGGVYADLDFIFTRPLDDVITGEHDLYFYKSTQAVVRNLLFLGNAFMASKPCQPFWLNVAEYMFALPAKLDPSHHTGPRALGAYFESLETKPNVRVFDGDYFDNEKCADGVGKRLYGYHVRTATWQHTKE